jgi:hypothetical protein
VSRPEEPAAAWNALALALMVLAGGLSLAMPFSGDQALFAVYGRQLAHGAVLYRDVFDVKQPGIFWFYASGGRLFGFTEVGIHLLELLYWLAFSILVLLAFPRYFTKRWGAPLVLVFTVVVYYLYADLLDLTQIEILVAFPILLAWWLIDGAQPVNRRALRRYAAAGLAAAAVVLLKYPYVLIVLTFIGYAAIRSRRQGISIADIRRSVSVFLVTLLLPLLIVAAYFTSYGQLGRIWWAYFELAPKAQLSSGRPLSYFVVGVRHFMIGHAPILILAVLGSAHALRDRARPKLDLVVGMLLWCAVGAVTFLFQGWAEYKWSLFTIPLGVLAVVGVEAVGSIARNLGEWPRPPALAVGALLGILAFWIGANAPQSQTLLLASIAVGICAVIAAEFLISRPQLRRWMLQVSLAALAISIGLIAIAPVKKTDSLMHHDFALTVDARADLRQSWNSDYGAVDADLEVIRQGHMLPGPIYVLGNPLVLLRANRAQAVPILGWGPEIFDDRAWSELESDLRSTLPPYIVVNEFSQALIRSRHPDLMMFIRSRYKIAFIGASGTWYVLR